MSVFVFAIDGSHLSIKHKTSDLFVSKGTQPCQLIVSFIFGIFLNMWTCVTKFSSQVKCYTNIFNWISFCWGDRKIWCFMLSFRLDGVFRSVLAINS